MAAKKTGTAASAGKRSGKASTRSAGKGSGKASTRSAGSGKSKTRARAASGESRASAKREKEMIDYALVYEIVLWVILALAVLIFIGMIGFGGVIGRGLAGVCFGLFGVMAYLFPFLAFFLTAFLISNFASRIARIKAAAVLGLYLTLCGLAQMVTVGYNSGYLLSEYYEAGTLYHTGGGWFGGCLVSFFCPGIGVVGTYLIHLIMAAICLILITQKSLFAGAARRGSSMMQGMKRGRERRIAWQQERARRREEEMRLQESREQPADSDTLYLTDRKKHPERYKEERKQKDEVTDSFSVLPKEKELRLSRKVTGVTRDTSLFPELLGTFQKKKEASSKTDDAPAAHGVYVQEELPGLKIRGAADGDAGRKIDMPAASAKSPKKEEETTGKKRRSTPSAVTSDTIFRSGKDTGRSASGAVVFTDEAKISELSDEAKKLMDAQGAQEKPQKEPGTKSAKKPRASAEEIAEGIEDVAQEIAQQTPVKPEYRFPPVSLLKQPAGKGSGSTEAELRETAAKLQQVLKTFGVNVKVTDVTCGPSVTRYEMMPEMGVKVSKIVSLQDDIKLNLAVTDIRIEAPIPGKSAVGIEVPNKKATGVLLRELIEAEEFTRHKSNLAYAVGKDIAGNIIVSDIAKMPHLLIAGATGSGKSVFINTLIMSIIYKAKPEEVKLIMIDPKVVELSVYNGIPHLFIPVVTDPKKAAGALNWAVAEMMQRYNKFAETGVRDLKGYNQRVDQLGDLPDKPEKMPQIVVIVDELADLMMVASSEVEDAICRLAQLARAAGIHLVIATQRPSVDVITGLIKANMPSRIAFSVSSGVDSRTILDTVGAEKLLGNGDMLFAPQTYKQPLRVQGAFVSDEEVAQVVEYIKAQGSDEEQEKLMAERMERVEKAASFGNGGAGGGADQDELFIQAAKFIIEKDKASIGMLQRWFKIGFNRAARIMDQLSEAGVVGPEEGTKPRKVLMSLEEFENTMEAGE